MELIYSKKFNKLSRKILTSKVTQVTPQVGPLNLVRVATTTRLLPDVNFWYLFSFLQRAPGLAKRNIKKKRSKRYTPRDVTLVIDVPTNQYSIVVLKIFEFLSKFKDKDDFKLTKFSAGGEASLLIKNCVVDDDTKELGVRTNFFVDDIFLYLKIGVAPQINNENLYIIEMFHLLEHTLFKS